MDTKTKHGKSVMADSQKKLPALNNPNDPAPIAKLIELRNKGLTYEEIGNMLGRSKVTIFQRLKPFKKHIDNLEAIKKYKADTLAVYQSAILDSLTEADLKKASAYQKVGMYGILYDKERLERGQSTGNLSINVTKYDNPD